MLRVERLQSARDREQSTIVQLTGDLTSEEDDAWAIYVPPADVAGKSNSDGHEVDFFARDGKQLPYFWAYTYDSGSHTVRRYRFGSPGGAAALDESYAGIDAFSARTYPVTALQDASTPVYSSLYEGASLRSGIVHFYPGMPWIAGGNNITSVQFAGATMRRDLQLVTQTAPSGFTVVLNYTPSPSPTPGALQAWPAYVELPIGGQALQTAYVQPRRDFASLLNRVLGGGVAQAALSPCGVNQGRAFSDLFGTVLANATPPPGAMPAGVTASTNSSGCITINDGNASNVELYEPGSKNSKFEKNTSCGAAVSDVSSFPASMQGENIGLRMQGGAFPNGPCSATWADSTGTATSVGFQVSGCNGSNPNYIVVGVNMQCAVPIIYADGAGADCDPSTGNAVSSYTGTGHYAIVGPGSDDGTIFTRTGTGTVTIKVYTLYTRASATPRRSGGYQCSYSTSSVLTDTIAVAD